MRGPLPRPPVMQALSTTTRTASGRGDGGIPVVAAILCPVGAFFILCVIVGTASMRVNERDANEFASFFGGYAFLLVSVSLLVACAYLRGRQNAREARENLALIERSMAEIARRRREDGVVAASGAGGREGIGRGLNLNLNAPGNRDREWEWEFIEGLFAAGGGRENEGPTTPWGGDPDFASYVDLERWMTTNNIRVPRTYRILTYAEKEEGRRRAIGRRLVAALKRCSLKVEERHLIVGVSAGGSSGDDVVCVLGRTEEGEAGGGDIESGRRVDHQNADENSGHDEYDGDRGVILGCCNWKSRMESERADQGVESSRSDTSETGSIVSDDAISTESTAVAEVAVNCVVESQTLDEMNTNVVLWNGGEDHKTSTSPLSAHSEVTLAAASGSTSTSDPTNPPSLHRACDIPAAANVADEDDNNKYFALCVPDIASPCNNHDDSTSATRAVPPTCAICLLQYRPGSYVTWSSNKDCCHIFHRDCILMWVLKVGGDGEGGRWRGLCPCCRGEFVSVSLFSELADAINVSNNGRDGNDDHTTMEEGGVGISEDDATAITTVGAPQADRYRHHRHE